MTWGPFAGDLDPAERTARLRCLRLAVKLLVGPRGVETRHALLVAEIDPNADTLAAAQVEFDRLSPLDRRRVLASYCEVV